MSRFQKPTFLEQFSSLLGDQTQAILRKRKSRIASGSSSISLQSGVSSFFERKIQEFNGNLEYDSRYHTSLRDALNEQKIGKEESESLDEVITSLQGEMTTVKH